MNSERWRVIKELFQAALDRPVDERMSYLDRVCGTDSALRLEVESLLGAHAEADDVIERAAAFPHHVFDMPGTHPTLGRRIGAYRIEREIGRGGMGTVYLATRADEAFRKQVAIKVVGRGFASDDIVRRFQSERQILANLDHPNIARLLDGGTTEDNLPYFVMEYIEGQSITEYCDTRAMKTVDRLTLFRDVCAAVEYAHRNRVVHRDIKPGNILVTSNGVPKLLDFGIAKILDSELSPHGQTKPTLGLMTPDYASPEQIRADGITVASDVYSLGVLLYELLTGHRPYRVEGRRPTDLAHAICEQQPVRPSTAISRVEEVASTTGSGVVMLTPERVSGMRDGQPERLRRRLAGDLDTIVLMALRKEPTRRYHSVDEFSNDIARHLEGWPVKARQDSVAYRMSKLVTRHPIGAAAAALAGCFLMLGVLIFTGHIAVGWRSARIGALVSSRAIDFAKRDWLMIADFENGTGDSIFDSTLNTAITLSLEQSRHVNVFPRRSVEGSLRRMKKPVNTIVDAEAAREIAQREGLRLVLAPTIGEVGGVYLLSTVLLDPSTGVTLKSESARARSKHEILGALDELSRKVRQDLGEVGSAIVGESKALSQVTTASLDALKLFSVGQERARGGNFEEAKVLYERATQIDPRFVAARGSLGMIEFELFNREKGKNILADLLSDVDSLTDREQYNVKAFYATVIENDFPKAVDTWKAALALYPDSATAHNNLGRTYLLMKRYEDAAASFKEAIRLDPYLMPSYFNLNDIYLRQQGDPEAAIALCKRQLSYDDRDIWAHVQLGWAYLGTGRLEDARTAYEGALEIGHAYTEVLEGLGTTYRLLGRHVDALRVYLRILEVDSRQVWANYDAGVVCQLMHDERAARRYFDRFRQATEQRLTHAPKNAQYYFDLARTCTRLGDRKRGWSFGEKARELNQTAHFNVALLLTLQGRTQEALDALDLAVKEGFRDSIRMRTDPDLAPLASEPRFQELLKGVSRS